MIFLCLKKHLKVISFVCTNTAGNCAVLLLKISVGFSHLERVILHLNPNPPNVNVM